MRKWASTYNLGGPALGVLPLPVIPSWCQPGSKPIRHQRVSASAGGRGNTVSKVLSTDTVPPSLQKNTAPHAALVACLV
jgi:hypothetical protein